MSLSYQETGNKAADVIKWEVGRRMPAELRGVRETHCKAFIR